MARAVSVSIINQFKLHDSFCLRLASVHLTHPFHLVLGFQLFGHAVSFRQIRHDQLHAVSCFDNLGTILSYAHPLIAGGALRCAWGKAPLQRILCALSFAPRGCTPPGARALPEKGRPDGRPFRELTSCPSAPSSAARG